MVSFSDGHYRLYGCRRIVAKKVSSKNCSWNHNSRYSQRDQVGLYRSRYVVASITRGSGFSESIAASIANSVLRQRWIFLKCMRDAQILAGELLVKNADLLLRDPPYNLCYQQNLQNNGHELFNANDLGAFYWSVENFLNPVSFRYMCCSTTWLDFWLRCFCTLTK